MRPRKAPFRRKGSSNKGGASDQAQTRAVFEALCGGLDLGYVIGIDPDVHTTGICAWKVGSDLPHSVACTHVSEDLHGQQAGFETYRQTREKLGPKTSDRCLIVVEAMRVRRADGDGATKNPQSLVDVAFCAGMAAGAVLDARPASMVLAVEPGTWKGGVPKLQHHQRLLTQLGWEPEVLTKWARPKGGKPKLEIGKVGKPDWQHVMDAIGLAKWGIEEFNRSLLRYRRQQGK